MIPNLARLMNAYPIIFEMHAITFPNARSLDNKTWGFKIWIKIAFGGLASFYNCLLTTEKVDLR